MEQNSKSPFFSLRTELCVHACNLHNWSKKIDTQTTDAVLYLPLEYVSRWEHAVLVRHID